MSDKPVSQVPVYFIGTEYPKEIGPIVYFVRGKTYHVPRSEDGGPEIGGTLMVDERSVKELIEKARYFNGKKMVEVLTTDSSLAASVTSSFNRGERVSISARLDQASGIVSAPSKEEILATLSEEELETLLNQKKANSDSSKTARVSLKEKPKRSPKKDDAESAVVELQS